MDREDKILSYVQGRMPTQGAVEFEEQIAKDSDLKAEVTAMLAVRTAMADDHDKVPADGWDRFAALIETNQNKAANDNKPFRFSLGQVAAVELPASWVGIF